MATYCIGTGKDIAATRAFAAPAAGRLDRTLGKLNVATVGFLNTLIDDGADVYQLFDSWAGMLSPAEYDAWAQPLSTGIFAAAIGIPRILFVKEGPYLDRMCASGADVISLGTRHDLAGRARLPHLVFQGNVNEDIPARGDAGEVAQAVHACVAAGGGQRHIVNLNHGVDKATPVANFEAYVRARRPGEPATLAARVCPPFIRRLTSPVRLITGTRTAPAVEHPHRSRRSRSCDAFEHDRAVSSSRRDDPRLQPKHRELLEAFQKQLATVAVEPAPASPASWCREANTIPRSSRTHPASSGRSIPEFLKADASPERVKLAKARDLANPRSIPDHGFAGGVVIDSTGLVLTPYHVIAGATKIHVFLGGGARMPTSMPPMPARTSRS